MKAHQFDRAGLSFKAAERFGVQPRDDVDRQIDPARETGDARGEHAVPQQIVRPISADNRRQGGVRRGAEAKARRGQFECRAGVRKFVHRRIRRPDELRRPCAETDVRQRRGRVQRPQTDARLVEVFQNELPEGLRVHRIQQLEAVELAPHDLLLAEADVHVGDVEIEIGVAQFELAGVAEGGGPADRRIS